MGDFFLDLSPPRERRLDLVARQLRFQPHVQVQVLNEPGFGFILTFTDDSALWATFRGSDGTIAAVAGRLAMDESDWAKAESFPGQGGLAARALAKTYQEDGIAAWEQFGGNCVLFLFDALERQLHIVTDRAGAFPAFQVESPSKLAFGSHPDVLAHGAGMADDLDEVSLAEFLLSSTVTPPFTYYRQIRALPQATVYTIDLGSERPQQRAPRSYFDLAYRPEPRASINELAEELATALKSAVRRRTLPRFGRTAVALSGGLDSRAILACVENRDQIFAFTCYNEPNRELAVAEQIAKAVGVPFYPWRRSFEYYGDTAELGVRISGGMGTFANNHFLGIVDNLRQQDASNLLTGCYCDYLFKGLPLNRQVHWLTGRERLGPFQHEFYFSHYNRQSPLLDQVRARWESRVPAQYQKQESEADVFQVEARRTFPLCYEGDNQQRVVPQRVAGWYLPVADRDLLNVYRKLPWHAKLNRAVYSLATVRLCTGPLAKVPDANTGVPPGSPLFREALSNNLLRLQRKLHGHRRTIATDGSWPDWTYYVRNSARLRALWRAPQSRAEEVFRKLVPASDVRPDPSDYQNGEIFLFVPLLTLKLWFQQWHS